MFQLKLFKRLGFSLLLSGGFTIAFLSALLFGFDPVFLILGLLSLSSVILLTILTVVLSKGLSNFSLGSQGHEKYERTMKAAYQFRSDFSKMKISDFKDKNMESLLKIQQEIEKILNEEEETVTIDDTENKSDMIVSETQDDSIEIVYEAKKSQKHQTENMID